MYGVSPISAGIFIKKMPTSQIPDTSHYPCFGSRAPTLAC